MRLNCRSSTLREGANHQRFCQARHADQQAVPACKQCDEQLFDYLPLTDDRLRQLRSNLLVGCLQLLGG